MSLNSLISAVYLLSAITFVLGLKLLTVPASARRGLFIAMVGIIASLTVTLMDVRVERFEYLLAGLAVGAFAGLRLARSASANSHLSVTALLNGFGGLAALLATWAEFHAHPAGQGLSGGIVLWLAAVLGGIAFSGSVTAWGRLAKKPGLAETAGFAGQGFLAKAVMLALLVLGVLFSMDTVAPEAYRWFALFSVAAVLLGYLWVVSLSSMDIQAALAVLGACTGLSACALGFIFQNPLLVAAGALAGGSGVALALAVCKAANRPPMSLLGIFISRRGAEN